MVFPRPHILLAAASLLRFAAAVAPDVTVVETVTKTHTVCPLTTLLPTTCAPYPTKLPEGADDQQPDEAEMSEIYESWLSEHAEVTKTWGDWTVKPSTTGGASSTGKSSGYPTTTGTGSTTSRYTGYPTTTGTYNGTTSSYGTNSTSTTTRGTNSTTTTSATSTPTCFKTGKAVEGKKALQCNSETTRSKWCNGKSIDTDYYKDYSSGQKCIYDLTITNTTLTFDKGPVGSFAINGQSPGPVIECNWGDEVIVTVHNLLQDNATTIHWHGIRQVGSNDMDGVPGVSECAIVPGTSKTYKFIASSYGTGWYHSHLLAQYGDGIRGPIIIHGPATANYDYDMGTVLINDAFSVSAFQQAYRVAHFGTSPSTNYLLNGLNVSPDNGSCTGKHALWKLKPGKKHRFRFINSAVQDVYSLHFDNHVMKVIGSDFVPLVPYDTEWLNIGCGQRYDVIIEANQPVSSYFFRAVVQTACPSTSLNNGLGTANGIIQYEGAPDVLPASNIGDKTPASFATCADEPLAKLIPHLKKSGGDQATFQSSVSNLPTGGFAQTQVSPDHLVFQWFINNAVISINYTQPTLQTLFDDPEYWGARESTNQSALISNAAVLRKKNEWVYFVIASQFFPSHPMHLHGHDMSILGSGVGTFSDASTLNFENPLRRDTVMLQGGRPGSPLGYTVIGFETDNPGAWLMHCHIVWHVEGGLAMQFIERPDDIDPGHYVNKPEYQAECAAMDEWVKDPHHLQEPGQAGLKRGLDYSGSLAGASHLKKRHLKHGHF